jgi:hypothetical protein
LNATGDGTLRKNKEGSNTMLSRIIGLERMGWAKEEEAVKIARSSNHSYTDRKKDHKDCAELKQEAHANVVAPR